MANKILTVFQNLERTLGGDWGTTSKSSTYDFTSTGSTVIYRTDDREDYERKKLELKQQNYLNQMWRKTNISLENESLNGLSAVKMMYRDVELMDASPEIGAALDLYAQESTIPNSKGAIVNVYSDSQRIKSVIEDLLVNRLEIQTTAPMIIRALCKYGNQYMLLNVNNQRGIVGWRQLPCSEIERVENGVISPYSVTYAGNDQHDEGTTFVWIGGLAGTQVYRNWQVGHFRLLLDSIFLPYGCVAEDTRIETEYGYKEIRNISEGDKVYTFNTETHERELSTVTKTMNKGEKDVYCLRSIHNYIEATEDHKFLIYVPESDSFEYKELKDIKEKDYLVVQNGRKDDEREIRIDKSPLTVNECTYFVNKAYWWDNILPNIPDVVDEEFAEFCGFMVGDGWVNDTRVNFALGEYDKLNYKFINYLERISGTHIQFYKNNHKDRKLPYSAAFVYCKALAVILKRMGLSGDCYTKRIPSWVYEASISIRRAFLNGIALSDGSVNLFGDVLSCTVEMSNEQLVKDIKILAMSANYKCGKISERTRLTKLSGNKPIHSYYVTYYTSKNISPKKHPFGGETNNGFRLEKVKAVTYVGKKVTYDITVANKNSNFFANGIVTHNCSMLHKARRHWRLLSLMEDSMLIYRLERSVERRVYKIYVGAIDDADVQAYVQDVANHIKRTPIVDPKTGQLDLRKNILCVDDDLFVPVRDQNAPNPIDTLPAGQNLTAIDDIKYILNKVLAGLRIPKAFLNFDEVTGDGKNLALMDVRFARVITNIQQAFLMELTKIVTIHLYLLGFTDDLTNFTLTMNNPSTQAEQLEIENLQKKISAFRDAVTDPGGGIPAMSMIRAWKEIMKYNDSEIKDMLEEIRLERALAAELEKTSQIIKRTGIFDVTDKRYGEPGAEYQEDSHGGLPGEGGGAPPMGGGGGGGFGDGLDNLGDVGSETEGEMNGAEGSAPMNDLGNNDVMSASPMDTSTPSSGTSGTNESRTDSKPLLNEGMFFREVIKRLDRSIEESERKRTPLSDKSFINEEYSLLCEDIDKR